MDCWHRERRLTRLRLLRVRDLLRRQSQKIVFTNGCFDLLHAGHIHTLTQARRLGDLLIVGLNSDDSVRRLKGPERPVQPERHRAIVLAALACVDYVALFHEDTPWELIRAIRPDVLVKGGDYDENVIVGAEFVRSYAGKVATLPRVPGLSTTGLVSACQRRKAVSG